MQSRLVIKTSLEINEIHKQLKKFNPNVCRHFLKNLTYTSSKKNEKMNCY